VAIAAIGAVALLSGEGSSAALLAPGAVAGALLLIGGPWVWRLAVERDAERTARIRTEERSDMAARVHDSVLQTLALIQRHAEEPRRVASLARRQERELRGWLYADQPLGDDSASLVAALEAAAGDVEELHDVRVEIASAGDCPVDGAVGALVLASREAMTNAAKFAGVAVIDLYVEVGDGAVSVFVRDRGAGFDRAAVPADRRGLVESIEGRMERAGGSATIVTAPGEGTEVELRLPRGAS
jgi:signal transduction histidine kinase